MVSFARYDKGQLQDLYRQHLDARVEAGRLTREAADALAEEYVKAAQGVTYLSRTGL
jgi:hypothetical protein